MKSCREAEHVKECQYVVEDNIDGPLGWQGVKSFRCTNCNSRYNYLSSEWLLCEPYCPGCGARVTGVVS